MKSKSKKPQRPAYANGGMVRGKGTGTSDSIHKTVPEGTYIMPADSTKVIGASGLAGFGKKVPVALSNGEYELPPEQVHAVGVQTLDQIKNATHTPIARGLPGYTPQNQEPRQFFASGGAVDDMSRWQAASNALRQSNDRIAAAQGRMMTQAPDGRFDEGKLAQAAEMVRQSRQRMGTQAPVANPDGSMNMQRVAGLSDMVASSRARGFNPQARQYLADGGVAMNNLKTRLDDADKMFKDGNTAGGFGKVANAVLNLQSDATRDAYGAYRNATSAALDPVFRFGSALTGGNGGLATSLTPADKPSPVSVNSADAPTPPAAPTESGAPSTPAGQNAAVAAAPAIGAIDAPVDAPTTPAAPTARQVGDTGAFEHGRGQYSDNPNGMGFAAGFTGRPSAQNMAAMGALAGRSGNQISAAAAQQPQQARGFDAPAVAHSGNDWQARNDLRNLAVSANSITNRPYTVGRGRNKQVITPDSPSMAAYQAALAADAKARGADADAQVAAMRENAAIARTGMSEAGANQRAADNNALEAQRIGIAGQEAVFNRGVKGFDIQNAQRKQYIQSLMDAATTPEERKAIAERFPDVYGRDSKTKMQFDVIRGKNDPITGAYSGDYAVAFDPETGTIQRMDIGGASQPDIPIPQAASERVVGTIYTAPNGQKVKWDGKGLLPV